MSGRAYLLVVALCAVWLAARAATQPLGFDFDEWAHLKTVAQIREFGGLPGAQHFPDIVRPETYASNQATYHMFPPLPYLLMAGAATAVGAESTVTGVLGVSRFFSALMAMVAVVAAGLAVRNLQRPGSTWSAPAAVTVGLALMPGLHSMGASVTASIWALAAVGLTTMSSAWAVRSNWSLAATVAVAGGAAFVVAVRASAYPVLLLVPLAMFAARLSLRATAIRVGAVIIAVLLINGWWLVRNVLVLGDVLGTETYVQVHLDSQYFGRVVRESVQWRHAASAPWPAWTLLASTDWLWVGLSRMLVRVTWIDPLTIALWLVMVLLPTLAIALKRSVRERRTIPPFVALVAAGGVLMITTTVTLAATLSAQFGWFAHLRESFIVAIPLVAVLAVLADLRRDRLRTLFFGSGLAFAAAANAGFMLAVLP